MSWQKIERSSAAMSKLVSKPESATTSSTNVRDVRARVREVLAQPVGGPAGDRVLPRRIRVGEDDVDDAVDLAGALALVGRSRGPPAPKPPVDW